MDQIKAMGLKQVLSAPRSPWQRAFVERGIGTIRRECLDHLIVFGERSLYRQLHGFVDYNHRSRTHLGLEKDSPELRPILPADMGQVVAMSEVGGLHHRYEHCAAYRHPRRDSIRIGLCSWAARSTVTEAAPVSLLASRKAALSANKRPQKPWIPLDQTSG